MNADHFRKLFLGKSAKRCRCGSDRLHIASEGGLRCDQCSPGESILDMIVVLNEYNRLVWDEYFADSGFDYASSDSRSTPQKARRQAITGLDPDRYSRWLTGWSGDRDDIPQQLPEVSMIRSATTATLPATYREPITVGALRRHQGKTGCHWWSGTFVWLSIQRR